MHFALFAATAALASLPVAVTRQLLHEKRAESEHWKKRDVLHPHARLPMRIGLFGDNMDMGHNILMDISDPDSINYGKYYSAEDVYNLFAPPKHSVDAVRGWLEKSGIEAGRVSQSTNKQWIQLDLTTSEAENLLQTEYYYFEHAPTGKMAIGCDGYHVDEDVAIHIDYITPGIKLLTTGIPKRSGVKRSLRGRADNEPFLGLQAWPKFDFDITDEMPLSHCDVAITPACIRAMYNFTQATSAVPNNELGIFEDIGDIYSQEDLDEFFQTLQPRIPQGTHPILHSVDGGVAPTTVDKAGPESNLDFQLSYPIIWPQNSILFQTDDPVYEANYTLLGFFNTLLDAIDGSYCNYTSDGITGNSPGIDPQYPNPAPGGYKGELQCGVYEPTNVISLSYGFQEGNLPANYLRRQCNEYMKLGLQGISIVVASGDSGVAGLPGDGHPNGCLKDGTVFSPEFPSACPYVTSVGATVLAGNAKGEEEAVTRFASGGGFSNVFYPPPDYQTSAVSTYLQTAGTPYPYYTDGDFKGETDGLYNRNGRGYPDVSAVGDNILFFSQGIPKRQGGSSASAPIFASLLTRINDERLKVGKSTVGFVNPVLYKHPYVLNDVTVGSNPGCETDGFTVSKGWDPVTGLGTPNYPAMLELFMSL